MLNLVSNAAEALGPEGGRVEISTRAVAGDRATLDACHLGERLPEGPYVSLAVEDAGPGIGAETLDRVFEPFFTTKFTGRGLGLAVVLGIVRRHEGCIRIESRLGEGTRFEILLPVSDGSSAVGMAPDESREEAAALATPRGAILVIDDDDGARELSVLLLERAGFRVYSASSGREALELFDRHAAEIVGRSSTAPCRTWAARRSTTRSGRGPRKPGSC